MSRKPYRVIGHGYFRVKAKNVKKGDVLNIGGVGMKVLSNSKNAYGGRAISCSDFRTKSINTLVINRNLRLNVTVHKSENYKKN